MNQRSARQELLEIVEFNASSASKYGAGAFRKIKNRMLDFWTGRSKRLDPAVVQKAREAGGEDAVKLLLEHSQKEAGRNRKMALLGITPAVVGAGLGVHYAKKTADQTEKTERARRTFYRKAMNQFSARQQLQEILFANKKEEEERTRRIENIEAKSNIASNIAIAGGTLAGGLAIGGGIHQIGKISKAMRKGAAHIGPARNQIGSILGDAKIAGGPMKDVGIWHQNFKHNAALAADPVLAAKVVKRQFQKGMKDKLTPRQKRSLSNRIARFLGRAAGRVGLSARDELDLILFAQKKDSKINNVAAGGAVLGGAAYAASARGPIKVGISYNYDGNTRGHLSQAEDLERIIRRADPKIDVKKYQALAPSYDFDRKKIAYGFGNRDNIRSPFGRDVMINAGFVNVKTPLKPKVRWTPDYLSPGTDKAKPVMPTKVASVGRKPRKTTIGIYGGGSGLDIKEKIQALVKNPSVLSNVDSIHAYGGSRKADIDAVLKAVSPELRAKFRVHGGMSRKAIQNATKVHAVNIGNPGLSTMHEIGVSDRPGMIWQAGPRQNYGVPAPHFAKNEQWISSRGVQTAATADEGVAKLKAILSDMPKAEAEQLKAAKRLVREGAESRNDLMKSIYRKAELGKRIKVVAGVGAMGAGAAYLGGRSVERKKQEKKLSARDELGEIIEFRAVPGWGKIQKGYQKAKAGAGDFWHGRNAKLDPAMEKIVRHTGGDDAVKQATDYTQRQTARTNRMIATWGMVPPVAAAGIGMAHTSAVASGQKRDLSDMERRITNRMNMSARDEMNEIMFARGDQVKKLLNKVIRENPHGRRLTLGPTEIGALRRNPAEYARYTRHGVIGKGIVSGTPQQMQSTRNAIASSVRRQRNNSFSSRSELDEIMFGDPRPRNQFGMFSGGSMDGNVDGQAMKIVYDPRRLQMPFPEEHGLLPLRKITRRKSPEGYKHELQRQTQ
jgi:hypothetical protein